MERAEKGESTVDAAGGNEDAGAAAGGSSSNGRGFFLNRPALGRKLFRLKSLSELQDTEANSDDSQFKVTTPITALRNGVA